MAKAKIREIGFDRESQTFLVLFATGNQVAYEITGDGGWKSVGGGAPGAMVWKALDAAMSALPKEDRAVMC